MASLVLHFVAGDEAQSFGVQRRQPGGNCVPAGGTVKCGGAHMVHRHLDLENVWCVAWPYHRTAGTRANSALNRTATRTYQRRTSRKKSALGISDVAAHA